MKKNPNVPRKVKAHHGLRTIQEDHEFEQGLSDFLRGAYNHEAILDIYSRFERGEGHFEKTLRKAALRALTRQFGNGIQIESGVQFKHPETFTIGDGVFIGTQTYLQGRHDGTCEIGNQVWIGPQSYFDARDLVIEDYVGWGPGAKVLGSSHTALPADIPIIQTDLEIKPVRIRAWADIGVNAIILPGVTIGRGSIVGAGAVVIQDVAPYSVVAGVPAKFIHWRQGHRPNE